MQALEYFGCLDQVEEQYKFAFKVYDVVRCSMGARGCTNLLPHSHE